MSSPVLHALIAVSNWGEAAELERVMMQSSHVVSVFRMMGGYSYLLDANFDSKEQLKGWIDQVKSLKLASGVPSVLHLRTLKIIDLYKQKGQFDLNNYKSLAEMSHFFMYVDVEGSGDDLAAYIKCTDCVHSMIHIQGDHSFVMEVIAEKYDNYKEMLGMVKSLKSVRHVETQEVISVIKFRNQIVDESGSLAYPNEDIRQLYTL
ncbi:MAG TPA: hypothetical protein VF857_11440 [Spirochaetota bacterium]